MRHYNSIFILIIISLSSIKAQNIDTLVDVGGYGLHFNIIKGDGTPILFEAGGGDDGSIWDNILEPIHKVTGTTLITYDRSGFGKSDLNPKETDYSKFGIKNGIMELEKGLAKLGYDKDLILVSHSYGGLYNLLYSSRHPKKVKSIVLIDGLLNTFWNDKLLIWRDSLVGNINKNDFENNTGMYYLGKNYNEIVLYARGIQFPNNIPIIDIIAGIGFPDAPDFFKRSWIDVHENLAKSKNVINFTALGSGHYIFKDNPALIVNLIIKAYSETVDAEQRNNILNKALDNAIELSIESKKIEMENLHSERNFNSWGDQLMKQGELDKALEVLKLNVFLFPKSSNVYDSYGEILLKLGRKDEAVEMYKKSIELNPDNENGKEVLKQINEGN
jgi:pimeloyl-ACP methyl ester carboxylesterase